MRFKRMRCRVAVWMSLSLTLAVSSAACGASVDGDQWVDVTVTNTRMLPVTLDTRPPRHLAPQQATVLHVDTNNDPQVLQVRNDSGEVLGCLTFDYKSHDSAAPSQGTSDLPACPQGARTFPG